MAPLTPFPFRLILGVTISHRLAAGKWVGHCPKEQGRASVAVSLKEHGQDSEVSRPKPTTIMDELTPLHGRFGPPRPSPLQSK
jgi:hypothetical protein